MIKPIVYVSDPRHHYQAIINNIDWNSFCVSWSKGNVPQITFNAYQTNNLASSLLTNENLIVFNSQQYRIKTYEPQYSNGLLTIAVTAVHVAAECQYIFQPNTINGSQSLKSCLNLLFDNNNLGFKTNSIGSFNNQTVNNFGNTDAKSGLSTILTTFGAEVKFDNKQITVCDESNYLHKVNRTLRYLHDTSNLQIQGDSTGLVNKIYCTSGNKDDKGNWQNFQPFYVCNQDSINKYGEHDGSSFSSNDLTNKNDVQNAATKLLVPEPVYSITVNYHDTYIPDYGEQWYLEVLPMNLKLWVEVTGYKVYPFDPSQNGEIDLNSLQPNILNINNGLQTNINQAITTAQNAATTVGQNTMNTIDNGTSVISYDK